MTGFSWKRSVQAKLWTSLNTFSWTNTNWFRMPLVNIVRFFEIEGLDAAGRSYNI